MGTPNENYPFYGIASIALPSKIALANRELFLFDSFSGLVVSFARYSNPSAMATQSILSYSRKDILMLLVLTGTYMLLAKLAVFTFDTNNIVNFVWIGNAVALAVLYISGMRVLPGVFLGAFLGLVLIGQSVDISLSVALRHTAAFFVGVWVLKREGRFNPALTALGDYVRIFALALCIGLVTALTWWIQARLLQMPYNGNFNFLQRLAGTTLTILIVTPLLLVWRTPPKEWTSWPKGVEAWLILGLSFLVGQVVFLNWLHDSLGQIARGYWMYLFITLAAVRLGPHGTVLVLAVTAIQALLGAVWGFGFFSDDLAKTHLTNYFYYMLCLSATGLALATYFTERKLTEEKVRESEERLRLAMSAANQGWFDVDLQTGAVAVSPEYVRIIGYDPDDFKTDLPNWLAHVHPDDRDSLSAAFQACVESGDPASMEYRRQTKSGDWKWIRSVGKIAQWDAQQRATRMIGIHADITERMRAELELKRSNAELEQFSYAISHDMRQPLRMIASYLQLLNQEVSEKLNAETREFLNFALDGAKRLDQMMLGLLEYSRIGRKGDTKSWIESRSLLDEALLFLQPAIMEAKADIKIQGEWPNVHVSRDEMVRLLQNLIGNAVKFHLPGRTPEITISSEKREGDWCVSVTDNGAGILPDQVGRLFQVFQRLQSRDKYEGTGIGLALCRRIAEHHHGRIWAESAGEGQGSRFCFVVPLEVIEMG